MLALQTKESNAILYRYARFHRYTVLVRYTTLYLEAPEVPSSRRYTQDEDSIAVARNSSCRIHMRNCRQLVVCVVGEWWAASLLLFVRVLDGEFEYF